MELHRAPEADGMNHKRPRIIQKQIGKKQKIIWMQLLPSPPETGRGSGQ
jgi:hypothetical protein